MGKGDKKTEKGKRIRGTYGKSRVKKTKFRKYTVDTTAKDQDEALKDKDTAKKAPAKKAATTKKAADKKTTAAKKTATKKTPAKKTTATKKATEKKTTAAKKKEE